MRSVRAGPSEILGSHLCGLRAFSGFDDGADPIDRTQVCVDRVRVSLAHLPTAERRGVEAGAGARLSDGETRSPSSGLDLRNDLLLIHKMLDISIQANTQQHLCSMRRISIGANEWIMDGLEQDRKLINDLAQWSGKKPSRIATDLGMAATTLARPASGKATTRLGRRVLDALQAEYPDFPGWSPDTAPVPVARGATPDHERTRSVDGGEIVEISRLDLSLPMGPGATVDDFIESEPVKFDLGYVRSFTRTPPHRLRLAGGAGDSMFPTLVPNDLVWIDTTQNQLLHADRIYAASINGGAAIKRLRPVAGGRRVLVISDNKLVDPYEVDAEEVVIWGRVIRFARDL